MKKTLLISGLIASAAVLAASGPGGVGGVTGWFRTTPVCQDPFGAYRWLDFSGNEAEALSGDSLILREARN